MCRYEALFRAYFQEHDKGTMKDIFYWMWNHPVIHSDGEKKHWESGRKRLPLQRSIPSIARALGYKVDKGTIYGNK